MSAPDITAETMRRVANSGAEKHVTLLLGAGASTSSGFPTWDELAVRLLLRSKVVTDHDAARMLVAKQDPMIAAEAARRKPGANWHRSVRAALYEGASNADPSALHTAVAAYAQAGESRDTTLLTLNFDPLLEIALDVDATSASVSAAERVHPAPEEFVVYHLHGVVSPQHVRGLVLTLSDFNEVMGDHECWQLELLRDCVRKGALLLAGTSYRDPDMRRWLHLALKDQPESHEALVLMARQGLEVSREDFGRIREALEAEWRAIGLEPLVLEDFSDAAQIVLELRAAQQPHYVPPQVRSQDLWRAHRECFDALQSDYSDELAANATRLSELLDTELLNLTLWIADGAGNLVRFAAHDRTYRSPVGLRTVPTGHDSEWIAGQALASESMLFRDIAVGVTRRWKTVAAVPLRVQIHGMPSFASAVLSLGLPEPAASYESTASWWLDELLLMANAWSSRLESVVDADSAARVD